MQLSKALKQAIDYYQANEIIDIILNMNEKYNLYNGSNFTWEYDKTDQRFYLIDTDDNDYITGIITEIDFYNGFSIHFIQLENDEYIAICDTEFND